MNSMREISRALLRALERLLIENYNIKMANEETNIKNNSLQTEIEELKENIVKMNLENQQNLTRLREEMMFRMYESEMDDYNEPN